MSRTAGLINTQIGRYYILDRLGAGGMATVFKAQDTTLQRDVAVKILHEHLVYESTFRERFEQEARIIAGFNHPGIVQIYDFDVVEHQNQQIYYMVMPYLSGPTLADVLDRYRQQNDTMPLERVCEIMLDLSAALDYAHARNMIHRDVKPGNILFDESDRAILTDFGIARLAQQSGLTQEGLIVGTPVYMSPEQATGDDLDGRSDLYALGIILYEMLNGQPPYNDDGTISLLMKHVQEPIPPLMGAAQHDLPELNHLIQRILAKNPADRYPAAEAFARDLESVFDGQGLRQTPAPQPPVTLDIVEPVTTILDASDEAPRQTTLLKTLTTTFVEPARQNPLAFLALGIAIVALLVVARATTEIASATSRTQPVPTVATVSSMTGMTGAFYFNSTFDDSSDYNGYWQQDSDDTIQRDIQEGRFVLTNTVAGTATTTLFEPAYTYDDVSIYMTASLSDDSQRASGYGIIFRYQDMDNYNVFAVDGSGRYSIWARESGSWRELREEAQDWSSHPAVNDRGVVNHVRLDVDGTTIQGYVNDQEVVRLTDDTFDSGGIGIYMATTPQGMAQISVDRFTVTSVSAPVDASSVESMTGPGDVQLDIGTDENE